YSGALRATITGPDASRTALAIATEDGDVGSVPVSVGAGQGVDRTLALRTAGPLTPGNHELVISVEDEDGWIRELAVFGLNVAADGPLPMGSGALGSASLGSLGGGTAVSSARHYYCVPTAARTRAGTDDRRGRARDGCWRRRPHGHGDTPPRDARRGRGTAVPRGA